MDRQSRSNSLSGHCSTVPGSNQAISKVSLTLRFRGLSANSGVQVGESTLLLGKALQQDPRLGKDQAYGEGSSDIVCISFAMAGLVKY